MTAALRAQSIDWLIEIFPEFTDRLPLLQDGDEGPATDDQLDLSEDLIAAAQERYVSAMAQAGHPLVTGPSQGGFLVLSGGLASRMIAARHNEIESAMTHVMQALMDAHDAKKKGAKRQAQILKKAGILGVGKPFTHAAEARPHPRARPEPLDDIEEAVTDSMAETEAELDVVIEEAAEASLIELGPEVIAALLVLIAVIIILKELLKKANCYAFMVNLSDDPIHYSHEYKIHGQPGSVASGIPDVMMVKPKNLPERRFVSAGFFSFHRRSRAYGTQYGWTVENKGRQIALGVECPLMGSNKGYLHFGQSAKAAAGAVNNHGRLEVSTKDSKGRVRLRCHGADGSPAYFIATVM